MKRRTASKPKRPEPWRRPMTRRTRRRWSPRARSRTPIRRATRSRWRTRRTTRAASNRRAPTSRLRRPYHPIFRRRSTGSPRNHPPQKGRAGNRQCRSPGRDATRIGLGSGRCGGRFCDISLPDTATKNEHDSDYFIYIFIWFSFLYMTFLKQ